MTDAAARPVFRIEHEFAAPVDRVWDAWTRIDQMEKWFGPKGAKTDIVSGEIREGSDLHFRQAFGGNELYGKFIYREIRRPERLVWEHGFADAEGNWAPSPFGGDWPKTLLTTVTFTPHGDRTHVLLTWEPLDTTEAGTAAFGAMFESMTGGWGGSFEVLDAVLAA